MKFGSALVFVFIAFASSKAAEIPIVSSILQTIFGPSSATGAAAAAAVIATKEQDISSIFKNFITDVGPRFQCGFGQSGVPVLDPLFMSEYSTVFDKIGDLTNINLKVVNVTTVGLSKYQVTNLKFNMDVMKLVLGMTYPQVKMTGMHETTATLNDQTLTGKGKYTVTVTNLHVDAVVIFSPFPKFNVSSIEFTAFSVDTVAAQFTSFGNSSADATVNKNFNAGGPVWVSSNLALLNSETAVFLLKFANERLQNFSSFANIMLAMINYSPGNPCN